MQNGDFQNVLRCEQCNKPFDKESTLRRHGYYCRSRKGRNTPRTKSCISCVKAKTRCDNRLPRCSRCVTKVCECHYPASKPRGTVSGSERKDAQPMESLTIPPSTLESYHGINQSQEPQVDTGVTLNNEILPSESALESLQVDDYLDWNGQDVDFTDFLNMQISDGFAQYSLPEPSPRLRYSTFSKDQIGRIRRSIYPPRAPIPAMPSYTNQAITLRPSVKSGASRIAMLMFHNLKSFAQMMVRQNTLPPFIHPQFISPEIQCDRMEPLSNCVSLVHIISSGIQGSRKLFWKNVRLECERMCVEYSNFNEWELLAAMQALSIYLLIKLDEGETEHNKFDTLLIAAVTIIAKQLSGFIIDKKTAGTCNFTPRTTWQDWIYEESRRRLSVVYRVLSMLVYFEPASMCELQTDLVLAPLPAKKQLWEASDELVWKVERAKLSGIGTSFALAANGELVKLDEGQQYCSRALLFYSPLDSSTESTSAKNWEEWCSGMDGFGGLIMLTASLIQ